MRRPPKGGFEMGLAGFSKALGIWSRNLGTWPRPASNCPDTGEIHGAGKELKGIYGFTIKTGLGDDRPLVEPFGNIRQDKESGHTVVQEVREPVVDVFEEDDHVLVVAEMPGVAKEDVPHYRRGRPVDLLRRAWRQEVSQRGAASGELCQGEDRGRLQ